MTVTYVRRVYAAYSCAQPGCRPQDNGSIFPIYVGRLPRYGTIFAQNLGTCIMWHTPVAPTTRSPWDLPMYPFIHVRGAAAFTAAPNHTPPWGLYSHRGPYGAFDWIQYMPYIRIYVYRICRINRIYVDICRIYAVYPRILFIRISAYILYRNYEWVWFYLLASIGLLLGW